MVNKSLLMPGDCLLYEGKGIASTIIFLKTWHKISHCEMYVVQGTSVAARDFKTSDYFPLREEGLVKVLRPKPQFEFKMSEALKWFDKNAKGTKYDIWGLLRFASWKNPFSFLGVKDKDKNFCSELLTRLYRAGGLPVFNREDADAIAPFQFQLSECFSEVEGIVS
jgi:hypothetical protein